MSTMAEGSMKEGAQILVVDDDGEVRQLLEDYLGGHGYRVPGAGRLASDGE